MNHCIIDLPIAIVHHSSLLPICVPPPKGQTVYSSKTKSVHPFESLPLQQVTIHFLSLCFKGLAPWELLLLKHDSKQALQGSRLPPTDEYYHTVRLWGHQIWKTNKRTSHYIACCHIPTHQDISWWPTSITT